jgi:hypothetical protein
LLRADLHVLFTNETFITGHRLCQQEKLWQRLSQVNLFFPNSQMVNFFLYYEPAVLFFMQQKFNSRIPTGNTGKHNCFMQAPVTISINSINSLIIPDFQFNLLAIS